MTRNFEKVSQEVQLGQRCIYKDESFCDVLIPPLRCAPKLMEINYDERRVGPSKESMNVVGKVTMESSNKNDLRCTREDPPMSIYQEGFMKSKDQHAIQDETVHVILPNKKPTKNSRKLKPLVSNQQGIVSIVNNHGKEKIVPSWDSNTITRAPSSNNSCT